ncbi:hypothetical protein ACFYUY_25995 [Kitasatospora sp. NPDC004745]|uniref:hypothetical protein n=1 Tax=Kitasatospora sp. NPDC004745 TaxID=3364019 RepID=UPI0036A7CBF0
MPHSILGVPAVFLPSIGYLAGCLPIGLAAARELRTGGSATGTAGRWAAAVWTMPGFPPALVLNPLPDGTAGRFLSATAAGAAGNAVLLVLFSHAAGLR